MSVDNSLRREIAEALNRAEATGEDSSLMLDINGIIVGYLVPICARWEGEHVKWTVACEHAGFLTDRIMEYLEGTD